MPHYHTAEFIPPSFGKKIHIPVNAINAVMQFRGLLPCGSEKGALQMRFQTIIGDAKENIGVSFTIGTKPKIWNDMLELTEAALMALKTEAEKKATDAKTKHSATKAAAKDVKPAGSEEGKGRNGKKAAEAAKRY